MMAVNNKDQSRWLSNDDEDIYHTKLPEIVDTNPCVGSNTYNYYIADAILNATAPHAASKDNVDQAIYNLILKQPKLVTTQTIIRYTRKKLPEITATNTSDKKPFDGLKKLRLATILDPCLRDQDVWINYLVAQIELENHHSSSNLDFDYIKHLLCRAGGPGKLIIYLDFKYIIKAQDWCHRDPQEILFWYEGFNNKIYAKSCRGYSHKSPIKVLIVVIGTRLVKCQRFLNMAFHLKEARKHVYRDFNSIMRGTTLSEDFIEAVDDLYQKQQCAHNTVFSEKIKYDIKYTFDNEDGDMILEGVQDIDSLIIDIMLDHFRHQEAHKFQDKGSVIRKLMRERRGHQATKAIIVNYDLGESPKVSWDSLIGSEASEHRPSVQEIANDSEFESTQVENPLAHHKGNKSSAKKENKRKLKPTEVENQASNIFLQDNYNMEEADTSKHAATHSEATDHGVKITTAMSDALSELSRSASTTTVQGSTDIIGEGKILVTSQPTIENKTFSQSSEPFIPLTEVSANHGYSTIEDMMTSRPRGRSNSTRAKSVTDVGGDKAAIRDESLGAARKRLKSHTPVPTRDSTQQVKADARRVRANSINIIRKRTMSRTMNRPNLAELGAIPGMLDVKESAVVDDQEEVTDFNKIHDILKAPQVFEVEESIEPCDVASEEVFRTLDIEDFDDSTSEIVNGNKNTPPASDLEDDHLLDTSERNLQSKQRHVAPLPETQEVFQVKPPTTPKSKKSKTKRKSKGRGKKSQQSHKNVEATLQGISPGEGPVHQLSEDNKKLFTIQPSNGKLQKLETPIIDAEAHLFPMERGDPTIEAEAELFRVEKDTLMAGPEAERFKLKEEDLFMNSTNTSNSTKSAAQKFYATETIEAIQHIPKTVTPAENAAKSINAPGVAADTFISTLGTEGHDQLAKASNNNLAGNRNSGNSGKVQALVSGITAASTSLHTESTDHEDYVTISQNTTTRLVAQMPESHTEVRDTHLKKARAVSAELEFSVAPAIRDALQRSKSMDIVMPSSSIDNEHQTMGHNTDNYLEVLANIADAHPSVNCFLYGSRYKCTYCSVQTFESYPEVSPAIICPGCGPCSYIRYCSRSCALLDSYEHSRTCSRTFESYPIVWGNLPSRYHQLIPTIVPENGYHSPELFRQMAYSWHCHDDDDHPIHLLQKWGEINFPEDQAKYLELFGPKGPEAQLTGDYFIFQCLPSDPHETRPFVTFRFEYRDEFNRILNCCFLDNNQHKLLEFLYRMIWNELNLPGGMMVLHSEDASRISHEFQHQFWLEFRFSPSHCSNRARFDFEREWSYVKNIVETMERRHPMLRAWRRDGLDQIPANPWDRFFGKSWPLTPLSAYHQDGGMKDLIIPRDAAKFFHQGWTGYYPLPQVLLEDRLLDGY